MKRAVDHLYEIVSRCKDGSIRAFAIANSIVIHLIVVLVFFCFQYFSPKAEPVKTPDDLGGMGGGGGGETKELTIEFGLSQGSEDPLEESTTNTKELHLLHIEILSDHPPEVATPVIKKDPVKTAKKVVRRGNTPLAAPVRRVRGVGPGTGGGAGGGSGGGIGAGKGYSIDWGGTGSRRLLSGKIPSYPKDSDKEMLVVLRFSVLPDGSVSEIHPMSRSDQSLERAAIAALLQWRFEALPPQYGELIQKGSIKFNFKFEH